MGHNNGVNTHWPTPDATPKPWVNYASDNY